MNLWNRKAKYYDRWRALPLLRHIHRTELEHVRQLLPAHPCRVHLDIGCGTGSGLAVFPQTALRVGADASHTMLLVAQKKQRFLPVQLDAAAPLPFQAHTFDLLTAIGLTEYLPDVQSFFREAHRVAAVGAVFVFTSTPPGFAAWLRILTGARPCARTQQEICTALQSTGWTLQRHKKSPLQEQWSCTKLADTSG